MKLVPLALSLVLASSMSHAADALETAFRTPSARTEPYMYWYWLNNNVSAAGITADLTAMKAAGIGEVFIGHVISDGIPEGDVPILSPEWWRLVSFAVSEGDRIGVRVGMFNGPGWSQSGGPWMKPEQSMRYLVSSETRVAGGTAFHGVPAPHAKAIQDVAVIAYPVPALEGAAVRPVRVTCSAPVASLETLLTQGGVTAVTLPAAPLTLDLFFERPVRFQTLTLDFGDSPVRLSGKIEAVRDGAPTKLRDIALFRTNLSTAMGPLVTAPFTFAFAPTETAHLRLTLSQLSGKPVAREIVFSSDARIDFAVEKQLGRMYPEPVPPPDAFIWPSQPETAPGTAIDASRILDLTGKSAKDGTLSWQAPSGGDWIIARIGMASTGVMCGPTPPQAQGLECDKMSREAVEAHFDGMIGEFLRRIPADRRKGFQHITLDSYEVGPQNWTDGMAETFRKTYGYDATPWLACLGGRVVGSREQTDRFLWDWRRLVADLVARNYVGGLKAAANRHGLKTWLENYGHWGFPGESLQYGGASDDIGGEYWLWSSLGDVECRLASSCAHVYGKRVVSAEAFTSGKNFVQTPANMKTRGDWCMTQGINHFVLHVYTHQPFDVAPGIVPWFGADFNRHSTWFKDYGKGWTDYLRRCCALLQEGTHAADVAYFFGEDTPCMNGRRDPEITSGFDYDYINAEVLLDRASCRRGRLVLPNGQSYRILVLPPSETMTPRLLARIESFVRDGLVLVGAPPLRSPSLAGYPGCDAAVRKHAQALWGDTAAPVVDRAVRKGRVFRGHSLEQVFAKLDMLPDVAAAPKTLLWTHRTTPEFDLYFVSNQTEQPLDVSPEFRVTERQPEIWCPVSGDRYEPALFAPLPNATRVPLHLDPAGSAFVIFRKPLSPGRVPLQTLCRDGVTIASTCATAEQPAAEPRGGSFVLAARVTPGRDIPLPQQSPRGVAHKDQNFVVFPTHGNTWGEGHSGAGLSVGRNGIAAFEHWHQNIAPVLVWRAPAPLTRPVHVALVYTDGKPALFVDGAKVCEGLSSGQLPHPSAGGDGSFAGTCDALVSRAGVCTEADIASLTRQASGPARDLPLARAFFSPADGTLTLAACAPGPYTAQLADGSTRTWSVAQPPAQRTLDRPWTVTFQAGAGKAFALPFEQLQDWKDHADPRVRYFSGAAVYATTFTATAPSEETRVWLDLGDVRHIARVTLNGRDLGVVWKRPFRIDLTGTLRTGDNALEIRVANTWFNALIGDERFPDDTGADTKGGLSAWPSWARQGTPRPEPRRVTLVNRKQVAHDTPLHASGLLGTVTLFEERRLAAPCVSAPTNR